jgi:hypothetical protein
MLQEQEKQKQKEQEQEQGKERNDQRRLSVLHSQRVHPRSMPAPRPSSCRNSGLPLRAAAQLEKRRTPYRSLLVSNL